MRGRLKKEGDYELFETTKGHQILTLDEKKWYALVKGQQGDIIVHTDSDHKKSKSLQQGKYYLADFDDDPEFQDMPHLFMEKGSRFTELILPQGLPTKSDHQKKLVRTNKKIARHKIMEHVKGEGDTGTEKQYEGKPEKLRSKTKKELYRKARKKDVQGRSKMNKEQLVHKLKEED